MQKLRWMSVGLTLGLFGLTAGGANCNPQSDFQCVVDADCVAQAPGGVCESNAFCTFPDPECPNMKRWHDRASSLANECFEEPGSPTESGTDGSSSGSEEAGSESDPTLEPTTEPDPSAGTTTDPTDPTMDPTADPTMDPTADPSAGSTSSATTGESMMTCDEKYGGAPDYELCEEMADSCSFNATVSMMGCAVLCESFNGECIGTMLNDADQCISAGDSTCDATDFNDGICVCSL